MNIRISKLTLQNFKCFRSKEFNFGDDIVTIKGRNGAGKTTIADAILFCLFGKNVEGKTDFDLKTHNENGVTIPNLEHSVEMELHIDEGTTTRVVTLRRAVKEVWIKKRGSSEQVFKNNTTEYSINGDALTAGDYKKRVSELVSEDVFRAITNPTYFPSLKWQTQREFLSRLGGNATNDEIAGDNADFKALANTLLQYMNDVIAYRKHLSYQIKQVKDKLDKVPVRLEEQNKALPDKLDWDSIDTDLSAQKKLYDEWASKIAQIKAGDSSSVEREERRKKMDELQTTIDKIESNSRQMLRLKQVEIDKNVSASRRKFADISKTISDLTMKIGSYDTLLARCRQTLDDCQQATLDIRARWADNEKSRPLLTEDLTICPTCGQPLPAELAQERVKELNEAFALKKNNTREQLRKRADDTKRLIEEATNQIKEYDEQKKVDETHLGVLKQSLNDVQKELHDFEQENPPTMDELLKSNEVYAKAQSELQALQDAPVTTSSDNDEVLSELNTHLTQCNENIARLTSQLATKPQYERIQGLIAEIEEEKKNLISQLSELEQQEDVAKAFQSRQNEVIEQRINGFFRIVRWKMTRIVNNGGDPFEEPYCECYVDGTAYHDGLNDAAKLNAGLDICEALGKHYEVFAPIVIDNAEAVNTILNTEGQQIRLYVSEDDHLIIS